MRRLETAHDVAFLMPYIAPLVSEGRETSAGGAETQIWLLARELVRRGRRVVIATHPLGREPPTQAQGVDIVAASPSLVPGGRLRGTLRALALGRALLGVDAPVLVQRSAGVPTALAAVAARLRRRRFVYSSSSVLEFALHRIEPRRLHVHAFRSGIGLADEIVVQTPEQVELCRRRFGREPVLIKSLAEPKPLRQGVPQAFVWIGRLAPYKHPEAVIALARAVPQARFWMIPVATGVGEQRTLEDLRDVASELANLELHAPRPRDELGELIARSVAVLSTTESEGMPNVFLEGWARGVPALTLSHDPDGVIEREGVGAVARGSQERFAELARSMWSERADQAELAAACQAYIAREHSIDAVVDSWERVLGLERAGG